MLRIAALGLSALFALGCATESVGLTEQDLDDIRRDIRKTYAEKDLSACIEQAGLGGNDFTTAEWCESQPFLLIDLFLEKKDGEASGFIKWNDRYHLYKKKELTHSCSVTVYDNGSYLWKCER
jgi:hypothetical protein